MDKQILRTSDYQTFFGGGAMRSLLDWNLIVRGSYRVEEIYSRDRSLLGALHTVWYTGPDGLSGEWRDPGYRPLRVREVDTNRAGAARNSHIGMLQRSFENSGGPIQLVLPAFSVNDGEFLLLDGNHRAVAAFRSRLEVRIGVFALTGPVDSEVLPDLLHFASVDDRNEGR